VRRDLRSLALDRGEYLAEQVLELRMIRGGRGVIHLATYPTTSDEVEPIRAFFPSDGIDEGKRLDREAQSKKLLLERLETMQLVAQRRGALEFETIARAFHLAPKHLHRPVISSVEEGAPELHTILIVLGRASAYAWTETLLHLEANAARRAWKDREQLGLIGKMDRLVVGAIT
jgi:hypothetical protein